MDHPVLPSGAFFEDHLAVMLLIDAETGQIIDANPAACAWYGWARDELRAMTIGQINTLPPDEVRAKLGAATERRQQVFAFRHRRSDGSVRDVQAYSVPLELEGRSILHAVIHDVTDRVQAEAALREAEQERERMERLLRVPAEILGILADARPLAETAQRIVDAVQAAAGYQAVGMRLWDGHDYPFIAATGYERRFLDAESTLTSEEDGRLCREPDGSPVLECTCGLVIRGPRSDADPVFTPGGSVWRNDWVTDPGPLALDDPRRDPRDRCVHVGFRSIALVPVRAGGETLGLLHLADERTDTFTDDAIRFFEGLGTSIGQALLKRRAEEDLERGAQELRSQLEATIRAMGRIVGLRDPYTAAHEHRVTALALAIADELGLEAERREGLQFAGEVHDIGKVAVPAEILTKPARLSEVEFTIIRLHPETGREILGTIAFRQPVAEIVAQHHERQDGSGYPAGLAGDEVMLEARILAVADVVEAMASHRPYRPGLGVELALQEVRVGAGTCFDGDVVAACERIFARGFSFPED